MDRRLLMFALLAVAAWWFFFRTPNGAAGSATSSGGLSGSSVLASLRSLFGGRDARDFPDFFFGGDAFERLSLDPRTGERSPGGGFLDYARSQYGNAFFPSSPLDASVRGSSFSSFSDPASYGGIFSGGSGLPGPQRR